jgi:hypothetical protein
MKVLFRQFGQPHNNGLFSGYIDVFGGRIAILVNRDPFRVLNGSGNPRLALFVGERCLASDRQRSANDLSSYNWSAGGIQDDHFGPGAAAQNKCSCYRQSSQDGIHFFQGTRLVDARKIESDLKTPRDISGTPHPCPSPRRTGRGGTSPRSALPRVALSDSLTLGYNHVIPTGFRFGATKSRVLAQRKLRGL